MRLVNLVVTMAAMLAGGGAVAQSVPVPNSSNSLTTRKTISNPSSTLAPTTLVASRAVEPAPKPVEIKLGMTIEGGSIRDENSERQDGVFTAITPKLRWKLSDWTFADIQPKFRFRSGHIQGATPTNQRESSIALQKAELTATDENFFRVSVGALETKEFHSSLLFEVALPGGLVALSSGMKKPFSAGLFALGGIPGSSTQTDISDEVDRTPSLTMAGLFARLNNDFVKAGLNFSSFQFQNLPSSVANDSVKLGNTGFGNPLTPVQRFQYQYRGIELSGQLDWKLTPALTWKNVIAGVRNSEAPNEFNSGWAVRTGAEVSTSSDWMINPEFAYFNVQPDAVVANFNDERINTNRVGYYGAFYVQYKKMFKVGGLAGERALVFENPAQGRESFVRINVEALDVSF